MGIEQIVSNGMELELTKTHLVIRIPIQVKLEPYITNNLTKSTERLKSDHFTGREQAVMLALRAGFTNKEIANKLACSERTVKFHVSNIYSKLDCHNRIGVINKLGYLDYETINKLKE